MRVVPVALATLLSILAGQSHAQKSSVKLLRGNSSQGQDAIHQALSSVKESSCMKIDDESQCRVSTDDQDVQCVWCKCSAIPSECLSVEQSKLVPAGVFDCDAPDAPGQPEEKESDSIMTDSKYDPNPLQYSLSDDPVDGSFCDPNSKSLSGYMDINGSKYDADGEDKHLFYWFFEKRSKSVLHPEREEVQMDSDIPIVLWLTGGPGCSSTMALLFENGPCKVTPDGHSTTINPYSWTETAHVLWLDQPAGVGYSYGKANDYNEEMISEDAYYFLQKFYNAHPEYAKNPLTVVGESYGGHYAPAIAHKIWTKNKSLGDGMLNINLAGLAVGNGLTDPIEQYKYYPEMAMHNSHGIKVVSEQVYNGMKDAVPRCVSLIEECNAGDSFINKFACQTAFIVCNTAETTPYQMTGLNPYDIRKPCEKIPLCYDFSNIETFLNLDSTKSALHVSDKSHHWTSCNMGINLKFHTDWMKDFSPFVADLLNDGIHALIYAGDVDYICNYLGNKAWTLNLDWKHKDEFNDAEDHEWGEGEGGASGTTAGLAKSVHGFTFLQVFDAGHMVPTDQPKVALEMISTFLSSDDEF